MMAESKTIDGGELLVRTLKQEGVRDVFVLHGGHLDPIFQACLDQEIRVIDTRHEAAAGHAADAYARATAGFGVAMATAGPGFTNIITAITHAYLDCSPVIFIAGAAPLRDAERLPLQGGIDQVAMAKPVTKWAAQATRTEQIPHLLAHGIREATSGRPGPVLLEIPIDVLFSKIAADAVKIPESITVNSAPAPTAGQVQEVMDLLQTAERPVMVAGGGTLFADAHKALLQFAETTGIPVYTNNKARGVMPTDHPLSGHSLTNMAIARASGLGIPDVALFLGARFGMFTEPGLFASEYVPDLTTRIIQVDICGTEMGRNRPVEIPVLADCNAALAAFATAAADRGWPDWSPWANAIHEMASWHKSAFTEAIARTDGLHPYDAVTEIMKGLPEDTVVCADGGEAALWVDFVSRARNPGQYMGHGYLGCLGIGLPFAMGAQVANPDTRVVCISGDGAAGLNIQEFDTMVRHNLPIVTIILNNKAWGMCVHGQQNMFGDNRLVATMLGESRYDTVAEGFGCHGEFIETAAEIGDALQRALDSGRPACLNIVTDLSATLADRTEVKPKSEIEMPYYENLKEG
ncbi:MAG: thiamine pyrophosphate-binding protein [Pseudomonadales bacterium]|nr:thiamine pyrophosphate-binding protein [Pseudomonadales bacterium]MDP7357408.1 thiamine pyrophosphate-binding protein [Pseudomonadales bacterium]HJN52472.1 thiamine pyrophosphate-binding protein [Pseudomonadales bacterium]